MPADSAFPYDAYPWTHDLFDCFARGDSVLVEKTRQMLASWAVMTCFAWSILFERNRTYCVVSDKEAKVDDGEHTHNTLIGKAAFILLHRSMPEEWTDGLTIRHLMIHNTRTNSTIMGEAGGRDAGRGGSFSGGLMDEASVMQWGVRIFAGMRESCPHRHIMVSTPNPDKDIGEDIFSWVRWKSKDTKRKILTWPWHIHPRRDDEWYAQKKRELPPRILASEIDIKYGKTFTGGRCFYTWDRNLMTGLVNVIPRSPIYRTWDFGRGCTACLYVQFKELHAADGSIWQQPRIFRLVEDMGKNAYHYRDLIQDDPIRYPKCKMIDIGDPFILESKDSGGYSWRINLSRPMPQHPYRVHVQPANCRDASIGNLIENVCRFMTMVPIAGNGDLAPGILIDESEKDLILHVESYSRPVDRNGKVTSDKPLKDIHSHSMDALQYLLWHKYPLRFSGDYVKGIATRESSRQTFPAGLVGAGSTAQRPSRRSAWEDM